MSLSDHEWRAGSEAGDGLKQITARGFVMKTVRGKTTTARKAHQGLGASRLAEMIEEASVAAYGEREQATGRFTMLEEHLELPFETEVLGLRVNVVRLEQRDDNCIVAVCMRGKARQAIAIADLPLPTSKPSGAEWIVAYRQWVGGR